MVVIGSGFQWNQPYSCSSWASTFGLSYPVGNDGIAGNGPWELFGRGYVPHTAVIGHDMRVVYSAVGANSSAINSAIETALTEMEQSVSNTKEDALPEGWYLSPAFPNPFNPSTTVTYTLPEPAKVTIGVYNIAGEKVVGLVNAYQHAGTYSVAWNGRADSENIVSNGLYFIKLMTPAYQQTRQVMFLK